MKQISSLQPSQQGAALVSVIFLVVVIAILGAVVIRTSTDQQQVTTLTLIEARVDAAALSGLEYAENRLNNGAFCPTAGTAVNLPAAPQTNGIQVTVRCPAAVATGTAANVFELTSTARYGGALGNLDYVERVRERRVVTGTW